MTDTGHSGVGFWTNWAENITHFVVIPNVSGKGR